MNFHIETQKSLKKITCICLVLICAHLNTDYNGYGNYDGGYGNGGGGRSGGQRGGGKGTIQTLPTTKSFQNQIPIWISHEIYIECVDKKKIWWSFNMEISNCFQNIVKLMFVAKKCWLVTFFFSIYIEISVFELSNLN